MDDPSGLPPEPPLTGDDGIDSARFRTILGHFATGVTVVTGHGPDGPSGMAANSFTSVSLDPPLVAFCAAYSSSTWPLIQAGGHYCVNVLSDKQEDVCRRFAAKDTDRFLGVGWKPAESGCPILDDVLAWIDCAIEAEHAAGDHVIVVGRAIGMDVAADGRPLLFYRGGYGNLEP